MALIYGSPNRTVYGTKLADELHLNGKSVGYAGAGDDTIFGSVSDNRIYGQDGDDRIESGGGHDQIWGGRGNDVIMDRFEAESVRFHGEAGNDFLDGGAGNDFLDGGAGNDTLGGGGGIDVLRGGSGDDLLVVESQFGQAGRSEYSGGAGNDTLLFFNAEPVNEVHISGESAGTVGYTGADGAFVTTGTFTGMNVFRMNWDNGSLVFHGGNSDATVIGGDAPDIMVGADGYETYTGNGGNDSFVFAFDDHSERPGRLAMGHDKIMDFQAGEDAIFFRGGEGQMTTTQTEHDGMTTFSSYDTQGHLIHELDVLGVIGLPPIAFDGIA